MPAKMRRSGIRLGRLQHHKHQSEEAPDGTLPFIELEIRRFRGGGTSNWEIASGPPTNHSDPSSIRLSASESIKIMA